MALQAGAMPRGRPFCRLPYVTDEKRERLFHARAKAKNVGGVNRNKNFFPERRVQRLTARLSNPNFPAHHRTRRRCTQAKDHFRLHGLKLCFEPGQACFDFSLCRRFVEPAFAARLPLEVLHRIGDVDVLARNARGFECLVEKLARRADERMPFDVFAVSWLFADNEQWRVLATFTKYRLRAAPPQRTRAATGCCCAQL